MSENNVNKDVYVPLGIGVIKDTEIFEKEMNYYSEHCDADSKFIVCIVLSSIQLYTKECMEQVKQVIEILHQKGFDTNNIKLDLMYTENSGIFSNQDLDYLSDITEKMGIEGLECGVFESAHFNIAQAKKAFRYVRKQVNYIKQFNFSPLEKVMCLYHLLKKYNYNSEESSDHWAVSRTLIGVVNNNFKKIVCAGYSKLFYSIIYQMFDNDIRAFENTIQTKYLDGETGNHRNNIVYLKDDKYNIEGFYYLDITWDSNKKISNSFRYFLLPLDDLKYFRNVDIITRKVWSQYSFSGNTARQLSQKPMATCLFVSKKFRRAIKNAYFKIQDIKLGDKFDIYTKNYENIGECFSILSIAGVKYLSKNNFLTQTAPNRIITNQELNEFLEKVLADNDIEKTKDYIMIRTLNFLKSKLTEGKEKVDFEILVNLRKYLDADDDFVKKIIAYGKDNFVNLMLVQNNFVSYSINDLRLVMTNFAEIFNEEVQVINKTFLQKITNYDCVLKATNFSYNDMLAFLDEYPDEVYKIMKKYSTEIHMKNFIDALYNIAKPLNEKSNWSQVYRYVEKVVNQNMQYANTLFVDNVEVKNPFAQASFYKDEKWRKKLESEDDNSNQNT